MKNIVICKQCGTENPFYKHICFNCKAYLRDRVVNIDLWKVIGLLIENPRQGFAQIIFSEHKNFIFFILILSSVKLLLDSIFIALLSKSDYVLYNFFLNYLILLTAFALVLYFISLLLTVINKKTGAVSRPKDNFSILTYSFIPHIFALFFLFPIELILFGEYLFSHEPSPFQLKEALAYALLSFELLMILWSVFLVIMGFYTQSKNLLYSVTVSLIFNIILYSGLFLFSQLIIR